MEVAGAVFRQSPCKFSTTADAVNKQQSFSMMKNPGSVYFKQQKPNRKLVPAVVGFSDKSHVEYYSGPPRMALKEKKEMETKKKEMKKKMKLLKGLSKNLTNFSEMGFGLNLDNGSLDQQVKGDMISEATEVLLGQLQKLKAEKMEYKRIKKEEKARKKASRMMMMMSSSESSSSESDCDNVVDMKQLKTVKTNNKNHQEATASAQVLEKVENLVTENTICKDVSNVGEVRVDNNNSKIEVCMGGKCKKSGAEMLLENFRNAIGGEADVVGCKCMGKCRDGPNVRVRNNVDDVANPLCIGVGLEDVDSIVTNFFGGSQGSCSGMVPALSSA